MKMLFLHEYHFLRAFIKIRHAAGTVFIGWHFSIHNRVYVPSRRGSHRIFAF